MCVCVCVCVFVSLFLHLSTDSFQYLDTVEWKGSGFVRSTSDKVGLASECEPMLPAVASLTG